MKINGINVMINQNANAYQLLNDEPEQEKPIEVIASDPYDIDAPVEL